MLSRLGAALRAARTGVGNRGNIVRGLGSTPVTQWATRALALGLLLMAPPPAGQAVRQAAALSSPASALDLDPLLSLRERYHPLIPGTVWTYHVVEGGRGYEQRVELRPGEAPGTFVLETSSPKRRVRYRLSVHGETVLLHQVQARLSFLPLWRRQCFAPPLPFLNLERGLVNEWTWSGEAAGDHGRVSSIRYCAQPLGAKGGMGEAELEVVAACAAGSHAGAVYRAQYAAGIGLVRVESKDYTKVLVEHRAP